MENFLQINHHEFQLLIGLIGCIAFFAFTGIAYSGKPYKSPNLSESAVWTYKNEAPERCEDQGYFYEPGKTLDVIEDQDGEFYICDDMGQTYYLTDLIVLDLDQINNKVTIAI